MIDLALLLLLNFAKIDKNHDNVIDAMECPFKYRKILSKNYDTKVPVKWCMSDVPTAYSYCVETKYIKAISKDRLIELTQSEN